MTQFWNTHKEAYLKELEDVRKAEVEKAKKASEDANVAPTTKAGAAKEHRRAAAAAADGDDGDDGCISASDESPPSRTRSCRESTTKSSRAGRSAKRVTVQRVRAISAPPLRMSQKGRGQVDSEYDTDMDDDELVREGKKLAEIRDMDKVYPLLNPRSRVAVRKGLVKMVSGGFREHLTAEEKKKISSRKRDYDKVCSRRKKRNPFEGKRKHVGETYKKFMSEVNLVQDDTSSTSSDDGGDTLDWAKWD